METKLPPVVRINLGLSLLPLLVITATAGCRNPNAVTNDHPFRFHVAVESASSGLPEIRYSIENLDDATVYLLFCGEDVYLAYEEHTLTGWSYASAACLGIYDLAPRGLPPGAVVHGVCPRQPGQRIRLLAFMTDSARVNVEQFRSPEIRVP